MTHARRFTPGKTRTDKAFFDPDSPAFTNLPKETANTAFDLAGHSS